MQESRHIYIREGIDYYYQHFFDRKNQIRVFELGFGTGLNALLTLDWSLQHTVPVLYATIERYPLPLSTLPSLNYPMQIESNHPSLSSMMTSMHEALHQQQFKHLTPNFTFEPRIGDFLEMELPPDIDVFYYDAFAPESQPAMWTKPILQKVYDSLANGGILVTFCAKGEFKRTLREIGFQVTSPPGPVGKREITRALKG